VCFLRNQPFQSESYELTCVYVEGSFAPRSRIYEALSSFSSLFPSYIVHAISSYLRDRTFEASFQTATSSRRGMRAGVAQGGLISPVLFSLYVNDIPPPSHHIELTLYVDDTTIIATSRNSTLLVSYLESYLNDLQRWLSEWSTLLLAAGCSNGLTTF